jgi:diadenosine tetraphosphate (Ap4A) HIT family hydrolase
MQACELCDPKLGDIVFSNAKWRVILVDDAAYPGFCRVIWNAHVQEMTDLAESDRSDMMAAVWKVEAAIRAVMQPHKVNLASLGNVVPHLHWHVIPRYRDDAHFPAPVWAAAQREAAGIEERHALLPALRAELLKRLTN